MTRTVRQNLFDILEHIQRCEVLIAGKSIDDLGQDFATRLAVERAVEIISEASRGIPTADKAAAPDIPWARIADMGNHLRHAYHRTSVELLHAVATQGVVDLKPVVEGLYARYKAPTDPWPETPIR